MRIPTPSPAASENLRTGSHTYQNGREACLRQNRFTFGAEGLETLEAMQASTAMTVQTDASLKARQFCFGKLLES